MKTKDEVLPASKQWFTEIAKICQRFPSLSVVRDNSGGNTSKEINDFFTENGVKNYFSTPYEQWQNGLAESLVGSTTILGRTVMAESGGPLWYSVGNHGLNSRNATFKRRLGTTPHEKIFGV